MSAPMVPCHCLDDEGTSDASCRSCHGMGERRCVCDCGAVATLTVVEGRSPSCLPCAVRWDAFGEHAGIVMHGANPDGSLVHAGCATCAMCRPWARAS